ncbi:hypothetical protein Q1695_008644 [Nippostrongylus brasiliensis]|nr:hypothetical protein Q1695_008644 [Nippostrongylus brasiliensis]
MPARLNFGRLLRYRGVIGTVCKGVYASTMPRSVEASTVPLHEKVIAAIRTHAQNPARIALISSDSDDETLTFKALLYQTEAVASYLSQKGFLKNEVACFVLSNSTAFVPAHLAVMKCGGIVTSSSLCDSGDTLQRQIEDSKASVVFTDEHHLPEVLAASEKCSSLENIICVRNYSTDGALPEGVVDFRKIISGPVTDVHSGRSSDDLAVLPYTTVENGTSSVMMLTHQNVSTAVDIYQRYMERIAKRVLPYWDCSQENLLLCSSFGTVYGLLCLEVALIMGFTSVILKKFDPLMFFNTVHSYRPPILIMEPTQIVSLLKEPDTHDFILNSMEYVLCGGPPIGKRVRQLFLERFPSVKYMTNGAGLIDGAPGAMVPNAGGREHCQCAGCAISTTEIKVVNLDSGEVLEQNQKGELCVRGPTVTKGFIGEGAEPAGVDDDGWFHTGQVGHLDKHGNVFIDGRRGDLVEVDGVQTSATELEDVLLAHPSIADAAVFAIDGTESGQKTLTALIVKFEESLTADDVQRFVESRVSEIGLKLDGGVEFVASIPRGNDGYVSRHYIERKHQLDEAEEDIVAF